MKEFHFPLLENGFDFLLSSLEHLTLASSDSPASSKHVQIQHAISQPRHLKYALLHLSSGIELFFKERLRQEHWSLVFKDISKAIKSDYENGDFQSITFQEAQDRLGNVCEIEISEKQQLQLRNFRRRRNQLEHFGAMDTLPAVIANVAAMVSFLLDFLPTAFTPESLSGYEDLLAEARSKLGTCDAFIKHRWKEIRKELMGRTVIACPTCQQEALTIDDGKVACRFCNHTGDSADAVDDYVERILGISQYITMKEGGEWPVTDCPECGNCTLVTEMPGANDCNESLCFHCGEHWSPGGLKQCSECNGAYSAGDEDIGICDNCFRSKVAKDD